MTVRCLRCGALVTGLTQFCDDCAALQKPLQSEQPASPPLQALANCRRCGSDIPRGGAFCAACGERVMGSGADYADYGGFWIRFLASIVDGLIMAVVNLPIAFLIDGLAVRTVLQFVVNATFTIGFWMAKGATPGKMAMSLQIVMADGRPITDGAAVLRFVGYYANVLTLGIGYLMIAFTPQKRGLHDYIAGTIVVRRA